MTFAVLDEAVPADIAIALTQDERAVAAFPDSRRRLRDSELLDRAAAAGFRWLITCDRKMPFQQNLADRSVSVLGLPTQRLPDVEIIGDRMRTVLRAPLPGRFVRLDGEGRIDGEPVAHLLGPRGRD